mgnify:CR=1 FL=1
MKKWLLNLFTLAFTIMGNAVMAADLKIDVIREGDGDVAENGQRVIVHYEGRLTDNNVFDSSRARGKPFNFTIGSGQVIKGWERGVVGMKVGEVRRLTIPADLAYGAAGAGGVIPPNATLVFDIELLDVTAPFALGKATPEELLKAQREGVIVIDIRRAEEWSQTGVIEGAKTITAFTKNGGLHPDFQQEFMRTVPSPRTPILLYCRTGNRTNILGMALVEQMGFSKVSHLTEGIVGWKKNGYGTIAYAP